MITPLILAAVLAPATGSRLVVDIDRGWEFVRVKNAPDSQQFPDAVPTSDWKVVRVSSEETARDNGKASNAFDGQLKTFWHTRWSTNPATYPHELVVDLGKSVTAVAFRATPRQGVQNGLPKQFEVTLGDDLAHWGAPTVSSSFGDSFSPIQVKFPKPAHGRFLRFVAKSGHDQFCVLSEIGLARPLSPSEKKSWASQYNIENVNIGSDQYDLSQTALESARRDEFKRLESKKWEHVTLPHTAHVEDRDAKTVWQGVCYYRRQIDAPSSWDGKQIVLTLNGAMQVSDCWLNGVYVGGRKGGYLPVVLDLTKRLRYGQPNTFLVRLDCRDNPLVPPGKPFRQLDFSYYSGLYRDAFITVRNLLHITDPMLVNHAKGGGVYVTYPVVNSALSQVAVQTELHAIGRTSARVEQTLYESGGQQVAKDVQVLNMPSGGYQPIKQTLIVSHPKLWNTEHPNLYRLVTRVFQGSKETDRVETRVGIRSIRFTRDQGLLLNGKPVRLVGTNRHQEYAYVGNALTRSMSYRDMWKIKDAGFNCVRLSHYPQDPAVMDACDELGILTIPATAGWQYVNHDERFMKRVDQDIHELIRWHRNHPSVLMWEASLNETYVRPPIARRWHQAAHDEFMGDNFYTVGDCGAGQPWDMAYNGWDDATHSRPQSTMPDKPGYIREYGDYEFGGEGSTTRISRGQGEVAELGAAWNFAWSHNMNAGHYPWTIGDGTWVMYDYNRGCNPWIERSGIADNMRLPRFSYSYFQSQRDPFAYFSRPMVFIANYWTPRPSPTKVVVFSNCDSVELRLNGVKIADQKPDSGPDTPYGDYDKGGNPWDGGNSQHVAHPAFTFMGIPYRSGQLEAIGKIGGKPVVRYTVRTPGTPSRLRLRVDLSGRSLKADGSDAVFVYADVLDKNGEVCHLYNGLVHFVTDRGEILRESVVHAEAGTAAILLRGGLNKGSIRISAQIAEGKRGDLQIRAE